MFKAYDELGAMIYELTKPVGTSINGDIEYYSNKLSEINNTVLEAGVGTGRMLVPLVQKGFKVDGVDLSSAMLDKCKENITKFNISANVYQQDLTKLSLPNKYGAIIMPTGSFCLLPKDLAEDVLKSIYTHLEDNGKFIVDIIFPEGFVKGEVTSKSYPLSDDTGVLYTNLSYGFDWLKQKTSHIIRYELLKDGAVQKTEVSDFCLWWYGVKEFEMLLKASGFVDISYEVGYGNANDSSLISFIGIKK